MRAISEPSYPLRKVAPVFLEMDKGDRFFMIRP